MFRFIGTLSLLLLMTLPRGVCEASNGLYAIGYGEKAKGMGGVGIAFPVDAFTTVANPAGLPTLRTRVDAGLERLDMEGTVKLGERQNQQFIPTTSFSTDERLYWPEMAGLFNCCPHAFGLAILASGGWKVAYAQNPLDSEGPPLSARFSVYQASPGWGWQVHACHHIGVTLNLALASLKLKGLNRFADPALSLSPTEVTNRGTDYEVGVSIRLGWLADFGLLKVGAMYQSPTKLGLFKRYRGFVPGGGQIDQPSQFGIGGTLFLCSELVVSIEMIKVFWRQGKWFRNVPEGNNMSPFGAIDGPGLGWRDQLLVKIGGEWRISPMTTLRAGINHGNTPIGRGDTLYNVLTMEGIEQHATLGMSQAVNPCSDLTVTYIYGLRHSPAGQIALAGLPPEMRLPCKQWSVGVSYGYRF